MDSYSSYRDPTPRSPGDRFRSKDDSRGMKNHAARAHAGNSTCHSATLGQMEYSTKDIRTLTNAYNKTGNAANAADLVRQVRSTDTNHDHAETIATETTADALPRLRRISIGMFQVRMVGHLQALR